MRIQVEIGTDEQKALIAGELGILNDILEGLPDPPSICGIWVPHDFDKTVNELQGTTNYTSERGHTAIAKNIPVGDATALIFSKRLFTDEHDNHARTQTILHEFYHTITRKMFPELPKGSPAAYEYSQILYVLFDEYWANRRSFQITEAVYPEVSERYKRLTRSSAVGFLRTLVNSESDYEHIKKEIGEFRRHGDVIRFITNTRDNVDVISKSLVYCFSYMHHYRSYERLIKVLRKSRFVNESALSLGTLFKEKYEQHEVDIFEGITYLQEFMEKCGIRFEDRGANLYCSVLDI